MINIKRAILLSLLVGLLAAGCSQGNDGAAATGIPTPTISSQQEEPTETAAPPYAILLAGPASDAGYLAEVQQTVEQIALENGMAFERREALGAESAPQNLRLVVVLPPISGLEALAASFPETKFVALGVPGTNSAGNLTAVGEGGNSDFQAFLAGYIAAVEADDYRVGLVYVGDDSGRRYKRAFLAGAVYFCGFCNPYYPPFHEYPLASEVGDGSPPEMFETAANELIAQGVNTIHLAPGAQSEALYRSIAGQNLRFVGTEAPPAGLEGNWIASVVLGGDIDLRAVITAVLNGGGVVEVDSTIEITFTGLSEARLNHYRGVLDFLESGVIDPLGGEIE